MMSCGVTKVLPDKGEAAGGGCPPSVREDVDEFADPAKLEFAEATFGAGGNDDDARTLCPDFFSVLSSFFDEGESAGDEVASLVFFDEPFFESFVRDN